MTTSDPMLFSLSCGSSYAEKVARCLGTSLADHEERDFEDSEYKIRPLVNLRGRDVFVIQSLYGDNSLSVNDKLCRLLVFLGALKDAGAAHLSAVIPYLCFALPKLRLALPHIAADEQFARIPVLSRLAAACNAFFLRRGQGGEDKGPNRRPGFGSLYNETRTIEHRRYR